MRPLAAAVLASALLAACGGGGGGDGDAAGTPVTEAEGERFSWPDASPDGTTVAFVDTGGAGELQVADASIVRTVPNGDARIVRARYLPDGRLALLTARDGVGGPVAIRGADGALVEVPGTAEVTDVATGPGGLLVLEQYDEGATRLVVTSVDGDAPADLTAGPGDAEPDVSPDGRRVAYVRTTGDSSLPTYELVVVGIDGSGEQVLLESPVVVAAPDWSPDGTRLAFGMEEEPDDEGLAFEQIHVVGADGSGLAQVTRGYGHKQQPQWLSGAEVLFSVYSYTETDGQLFRIGVPAR